MTLSSDMPIGIGLVLAALTPATLAPVDGEVVPLMTASGAATLTDLPAEGEPAPGLALSISARTMRPLGPEPRNAARSMPLSRASRRASGETKMRAPVSWPLPGLPASTAAEAPAVADMEIDDGGLTGPVDECPPVSPDAADALSPSANSSAIWLFTFTPSVPAAISNLPTVPSSTASTSMVALSVSISAMISPDFTFCPSTTSHLASLPSSMVGDRAGIKIGVGMLGS